MGTLVVMVKATNNIFGLKYWGVNVHDGDTVYRNVDIHLSDMVSRGITKSLNGKRKMSEWINETKEGQAYIRGIIGLPKATDSTESPSASGSRRGGLDYE